MAKESAAAQTTQNDGAAAAKVAGLGPQQPAIPPAPAPTPTTAPQVAVATDQFTPLQIRALDNTSGTLAREFAMGAAKLCESPILQPKTKERARRLLRLALAALE